MATSEEIKQQAKEARMAISRQVASAGSNATNALLSQAVKALWEIALQLAQLNEKVRPLQ